MVVPQPDMILVVNVACSHCGRVVDVKPYRLKRNQGGLLFCSRECRSADGSTVGGHRTTAPPLMCPICHTSFHRKPAERLSVNYCSYACAAKGTGNLRPPAKGEHRSPATEFQPGMNARNRLPVGTVRIRHRRNRQEGKRAWVKVSEPNKWRLRAVVVWEAGHGPLAKGLVVHHRNRDTLDDRLENLEAISRAMHLTEHRPESEAKRATRARESRWGHR
jgi:HNH endonuclease